MQPLRSAILAVCLLMFFVAPVSMAESSEYRSLSAPPSAPQVPSLAAPPDHPAQPDDPTDVDSYGQPCPYSLVDFVLTVDCRPTVLYANTTVPSWQSGEEAKIDAWKTATEAWATVDFTAWVETTPDQGAGLLVREHGFTGPSSTATVHVHDDLGGALHEEVAFVVKGGPGGSKWVCKHECVIFDDGFFVSVDPTELSTQDQLTYFPAIPPVSGSIEVTFS